MLDDNNDVLFAEHLDALNASDTNERDAEKRDVVGFRIYFEVEGAGSFKALSQFHSFNTLSGITSAWVRPHEQMTITANAASGWMFTHWSLNGLYAGPDAERTIVASRGMRIKAHFTQ